MCEGVCVRESTCSVCECVCMGVWESVHAPVCMCVCERDRKRECVCICMCMCMILTIQRRGCVSR